MFAPLALMQLSIIEKIKRAPSLIMAPPLDTVAGDNIPYKYVGLILIDID